MDRTATHHKSGPWNQSHRQAKTSRDPLNREIYTLSNRDPSTDRILLNSPRVGGVARSLNQIPHRTLPGPQTASDRERPDRTAARGVARSRTIEMIRRRKNRLARGGRRESLTDDTRSGAGAAQRHRRSTGGAATGGRMRSG
jgi:hypothetical protein